MKKLLIIVSLLGMLVGCSTTSSQTTQQTDAVKFKEEYEGHNGEYDDKRGHNYIEVEIAEDNPVVYATEKDVFTLIDEESSGIVYFGFPECPWCRTLLPTLLDAISDAGIERIYYVNNYDSRDTKELNEKNEVVTTKEGTDDYYKLLDILGDFASVYGGLEDDSIKRLYFPTVVYIKDGIVVDVHVGTIDEQEDVWTPLTEDQTTKMYDEIKKEIGKVYSSGCSISAPACD